MTTTTASFVRWPGPDVVSDTGEEGMRVVAYWPANSMAGFRVNLEGLIPRNHPHEDVTAVFPDYLDVYKPGGPGSWDHVGVSAPLAGAVVLGDTSRSLYDDAAQAYWRATRDDLDEAGRALLDAGDRAYGCQAVLITELFT